MIPMSENRIYDAMVKIMNHSSDISGVIERLQIMDKNYMSEEAREFFNSIMNDYLKFINMDLTKYIVLLEIEFNKFMDERKEIFGVVFTKNSFWNSVRVDILKYKNAFKTWLDILESGSYFVNIYIDEEGMNFINTLMNEIKKVLVRGSIDF